MPQKNQLKSGSRKLKENLSVKKDNTIIPKHWYILVFVKAKPKLWSRFFKTEKDVKHFIKINKLKSLKYTYIKGQKALDYGIKLNPNYIPKHIDITSTIIYDYPVDRISTQDKKSFRTKSRRWKRDFGKLPNNHTDFIAFKKK